VKLITYFHIVPKIGMGESYPYWCLSAGTKFFTTVYYTRFMGSELFVTVKMWIVVFWVVTPCGLEGGYGRFEGIYRLHLQGKRCH
jgi:hypothetical protein